MVLVGQFLKQRFVVQSWLLFYSNSIERVSQLVTLPYNLLLQKTAREALGIDLSNQIVVIDEAHSKC